jgi:hypothetical protein
MIGFAEAKAEEMGDEARTPRTGGDGEGRAMAKPDPKAAAHKLLGGKATPVVSESRPTFEQLFPEQTEQAPSSEEAPAADEQQTSTAVEEAPIVVESGEQAQPEAPQEPTSSESEPSAEEEEKAPDGQG